MNKGTDHIRASIYLNTLCSVKPNRRVGSQGNRDATNFFARTIQSFCFQVDTTPFACLDYIRGDCHLTHAQSTFEIHISPYSLACDQYAELLCATTVEELQAVDCAGKFLLLMGPICSEQIMPKNFVFYNPEQHQRIIALLENKQPAALITATETNPDLVGALDPFPLFVDGDFNIPSVYCKRAMGEQLAILQGEPFHLMIDSHRQPALANNVIAHLNRSPGKKIVFTAHIDAYEETPGALDNASGTTVLLLLAELVANHPGDLGIEIVAFNGEDHYSAAGQMDYLERYSSEFNRIALVVNLDDLGYIHGKSAYSFYECPSGLEQSVRGTLQPFIGIMPGEPWYQGDHMIFAQHKLPTMAFTSELTTDLMKHITHTGRDTPDQVDCRKLVELAESLHALTRSFE